ALAQVNDNLQAIRRLAVQASNGTNSASDIATLQNEVKQRLDEINRISEQTDFNGTKVLSSNAMKTIQIGANYGETIEIALEKITSGELKIEEVNLNIFAKSYADYATADASTTDISATANDPIYAAAANKLVDADIKIVAGGAGQSGIAVGAIGANKLHQKIDAATGKAIDGQFVIKKDGSGEVYDVNLTFKVTGTGNNTKQEVEVTVRDEVKDAQDGAVDTKVARAGMLSDDKVLSSLDDALTSVSALRSSLGAMQNRFEAAVENLNNTINNLSSARSRIQDADFADEVSRLSNGQILQQAGTTVLAMANQSTQSVLSLLR
ncbi:MAG TPA: flagellin, partial [Arsenophonus apicola]